MGFGSGWAGFGTVLASVAGEAFGSSCFLCFLFGFAPEAALVQRKAAHTATEAVRMKRFMAAGSWLCGTAWQSQR